MPVPAAGRPEQQQPEPEHDQREPAAAEVHQAQDKPGDGDRGRHQHRLAFPDAGGEDAEGMLVTIEPMPSSALISAATAVLAPRSIELSAMTGIIDPPRARTASPPRTRRPHRAETELAALPGRQSGNGRAGSGCARRRPAGATHRRPSTVFAVPSRIQSASRAPVWLTGRTSGSLMNLLGGNRLLYGN